MHARLIRLSVAASLIAASGLAWAGEADWKAQMSAGMSAYRRGDYSAATRHLEAALKDAEAFGESDRRYGLTLNNLAAAHEQGGRYDAAERMYKRFLLVREKALGPDHPEIATVLNNLGSLYETQGRLREAEAAHARALPIFEKTHGADHPNTATSVNNLATVYRAQGRYAEAERLYRKALRILEARLGSAHTNVGSVTNNLAELHSLQGRYAEAETLFRRSLTIFERALGAGHPETMITLANLAQLLLNQGRWDEAEAMARRSLATRERVHGPNHPAVAVSLVRLAHVHQAQGRLADAEALYRRSLAILQKAHGPDHPSTAEVLTELGSLFQSQGRYREAEPLHERALELQERSLGSRHPNLATALSDLATIRRAQGRLADAQALYQRALALVEGALGPEHPDAGGLASALALLHGMQGRPVEAEPLAARAVAVLEKALGPQHPALAMPLATLATLKGVRGRFAESERLFVRSIAVVEAHLPQDHPTRAVVLHAQALMYAAQSKWPEGLRSAREATRMLGSRFRTSDEIRRTAILSEQRKASVAFEHHVSLAFEAQGGDAATEAFEAAQLARASDLADQVARMAARHASGTDGLARLVRERQDAIARLRAVDDRLLVLFSVPRAASPEANAALREERERMRASIAELGERLGREYPRYRELTDPRPLSIASARRLLAKDEALVVLLVADKASFVWAIRAEGAAFYRVALTPSDLAAEVRKLRASLDLGAGDPSEILARPFDAAAAHALYRAVFGPVEALVGTARHLIVVPDGALQSLPPAVLLTEAPARPSITSPDDYAALPWLAKRHAVTVIPAVGSLRALRELAGHARAVEPFGGFGDPLFEGRGGQRGAPLPAFHSPDGIADVRAIARLERLPETALELRAMARALGAPPEAVRLGADASESAVKQADLARYRILAFATHGLMAGEFKGLAEPALVLTPPARGTALDDGLLTASEVSQLVLDADWVVLSACNTAAPDGTPGAEGLSGLARAFFHAGARSLLVSHWAVSSEATVPLTTHAFSEVAAGANRAEALRRSMLALMGSRGGRFAHPAFWAPFVVVGEGGAGVRPAGARAEPDISR